MSLAIDVPRRLFTVSDYYRMAEAGILGEDDRVELIEGEIIEMPPIGSPHAGVVKSLIALLADLTHQGFVLSAQDPLHLDEKSEPEPDFMVLRPRDDRYRTSHPTPDEVLLLVEVSDTTLAYDRQIKAPLYARAGIPEVWIVDIAIGAIEVYRTPQPSGAYASQSSSGRGEELSIEALPGVHLKVDDLLGSA